MHYPPLGSDVLYGWSQRQKMAPKSKLVPRVHLSSSHCHSVLLMQTRIVVVICFWQQEYHAEKIAKRNARANLPERHEKLEEFVKHFSCYFRMAKSCLAPICKCSAQNQEKGMGVVC